MLTGVDVVSRNAPAPVARPGAMASLGPRAEPQVQCPFTDCRQPNPKGALRCKYCDRPLAGQPELPAGAGSPGLLQLPLALRDRFRVVHPLPTRGSEADLLLIESVSGDHLAVAKIYRPGIAPRALVGERLAQLESRYLLRTSERGTTDGRAFEVLEYCALGSLRNLFSRGPLSLAELTGIVQELAGALDAVHAVHVIHRDLKPENILLRRDEPLQLVLIDFGIASLLDATQRFTSDARTLNYAAPESLSGVIDAKADYWAMGMILLEGALGAHPFGGLSEAVILFHLATKGIDLDGIQDANLRKLLKGLLVRDPKARWGSAEIKRWLAGDAGLEAPNDGARAEGFTEPYHLAGTISNSPRELAQALSKHWDAGTADLRNGQLLRWFRDVQKDQDTVRLLLEMQHESQLHVDLQLLHFLLHIAPGLPSFWRGEKLARETLLVYTNRALRNEDPALRWLVSVFEYDVLGVCAKSGDPEAARFKEQWQSVSQAFEKAWLDHAGELGARAASTDPTRVVLFDDVVFGSDALKRPAASWLVPRLIAIANDAGWVEGLRRRVTAAVAQLQLETGESMGLIDITRADAATLLAIEATLPELQRLAQHRQTAKQRLHESEASERSEAAREVHAIVARIQAAAHERYLRPVLCGRLEADLGRYFELLARLLGTPTTDPAGMETVQSLKRMQPAATRLLSRLESLAERRQANSGWLDTRVFTGSLAATFALGWVLGQRFWYLSLVPAAAFIAWRLVPNYLDCQEIRRLAASFAHARLH
ncbi:MAG: serine/threonine-protein kinase [Burkholderiaceae bacterium]|jgi:tRNA A-37 threonylcarbamoyl transferase component Bud32